MFTGFRGIFERYRAQGLSVRLDARIYMCDLAVSSIAPRLQYDSSGADMLVERDALEFQFTSYLLFHNKAKAVF